MYTKQDLTDRIKHLKHRIKKDNRKAINARSFSDFMFYKGKAKDTEWEIFFLKTHLNKTNHIGGKECNYFNASIVKKQKQ